MQHAQKENIKINVFGQRSLQNIELMIKTLKDHEIELIVLAGFLLKIPADLIRDFEGDIINLHPALLPKYGGKGMYGNHVHEAVLNAEEKHTGITIHYVNEQYDEGKIIDQYRTAISENETIQSLVLKIKQLEKEYFPATIKKVIMLKKQ